MDVRKNVDYYSFLEAYASLTGGKYKVDTKHVILVHNSDYPKDAYQNHMLEWAFQDLICGYRDGTTGDDIAGEWLLDKHRVLWARAWLSLPISIRAKYNKAGG
jgi:hypothetical protein